MEPIAYLNGEYVPASAAAVSVNDQGFLLGVTVAEQLRTFGGKLFRLEQHLDRFDRSLEIIGVELGHSHTQLTAIAEKIVAHNHALVAPGDDIGLTIFATPGLSPIATADAASQNSATVCLHTRLLPFNTWSGKYAQGESLAATSVEQVSLRSWPAELKCRSRVHYHLADREANRLYPGSRAVMLDAAGFVTEATTANVLVYRQSDGLLIPPREKILPGISLAMLLDLGRSLGLKVGERDLRPKDVATADEVLLCSTSPCVLPVTYFNGQTIAGGRPGPVFQQLLQVWSERVGIDIAAQALQFSRR